MVDDKKTQQLLMQISRAREALGNALGMIQDLNGTAFDLGKVVALLAASVRSLFAAEQENLKSAAPIGDAMQNLREILQAMQDVTVSDAKLQAATTTIARILAILFPVYKELSSPPAAAASTGTAPKASKQLSHAPQPVPRSSVHDDRRAAPRKAIEVDIGLQSDSNFFTGFSTDISSGGLFVATWDAPEMGHVVNLNFHLPNGPMMSIDGEVCWTRVYNETTPDINPGVGVRFTHLSAEDANAINSYMREIQPMFFDGT